MAGWAAAKRQPVRDEVLHLWILVVKVLHTKALLDLLGEVARGATAKW